MILWSKNEGRRKGGEKGFALATVIVLTFFLFALVATYFLLIVVERSAIFSSKNDLKAEAIAEAGIEEVMWEYNFNGQNFTGSAADVSFTDSSGNPIGSYTVTVTNHTAIWQTPYNAANETIATSIGTYNKPGGGTEAVTIKAKIVPRPPFSGAITAKRVVRFTGNGFTDSYDSASGAYGGANIGSDGDVRTNLTGNNDAIDLNSANGNPVVAGDASTGTGSAVDDPSKVSGDVAQAPQKFIRDVTMPGGFPVAPSAWPPPVPALGQPYIPGSGLAGSPALYHFNEINVGNNDMVDIGSSDPLFLLPAGSNEIHILIDDNLRISGSAELRINAGATLILYIAGINDSSFYVGGNGNGLANLNGTQHPLNLQIYCTTNTKTLDVQGGPNLIAAIKAPDANIDISGSPAFYGAFVGNNVTASGGGGVHFDVQLRNLFDPENGADIDWIRRISKTTT